MWCGVVSLFPDLIRGAAAAGVLGRALQAGGLALEVFNPRDFTTDRHRTVDDRPYGGGPGMVLMAEPLLAAIAAARRAAPAPGPVLYLSPQGPRLDQSRAGALARAPSLILIAGRYEGVDERALADVDGELSIGDYVLSGGELPALVVLDAVARLLPGTLGNAESAAAESHLDGTLDYPHYTRPENVAGRTVPAVLISGDHAAVAEWRRAAALERTWARRPDLLSGRRWTDADRRLLARQLAETRVAED